MAAAAHYEARSHLTSVYAMQAEKERYLGVSGRHAQGSGDKHLHTDTFQRFEVYCLRQARAEQI